MKTVSLFSGVGGLDKGLEDAGFNIIVQCEKDEYRRKVLSERFPETKIFEDVGEIYFGESKSRNKSDRYNSSNKRRRKTWAGLSGSIDLLCGGFPCQDLSVAGKRAGLSGERSGLFFEFARIANESVKDDGFILIENVPGLFSSNKGEDFRIILETLSECGFNDIAWRVLNSQYFGVPQRRRRVFILGRRTRGRSCGEILFEPESGDWNFKKNSKAWKKDSITAITGLGSGGPDDNDAQNGRLVTSTLQAHKNGYRMDADSIEQYISGPLTSRYWKGINTTIDDGAAIVEEIGVRRLTPKECERLQGFPDDWTLVDGASDTKRYAAIGDAVTVSVAKWIGRRILNYA